MSEADDLSVDFDGPETVTEWRALPVDAKGRCTGGAYRLRHRKEEGHAALNDASGGAVATTAGLLDEAGLKAWAVGHVHRDMARRPDRRRRAYEIVARIASGPGAGSAAGTRRVLALTSAEALAAAWRDWDLQREVAPGDCDVVLQASAREDPGDVSTSCRRVAGVQLGVVARTREPSRAAGREQ